MSLYYTCPLKNHVPCPVTYTRADTKEQYHKVNVKNIGHSMRFCKIKSFTPYVFEPKTQVTLYHYLCRYCNFIFDDQKDIGVCCLLCKNIVSPLVVETTDHPLGFVESLPKLQEQVGVSKTTITNVVDNAPSDQCTKQKTEDCLQNLSFNDPTDIYLESNWYQFSNSVELAVYCSCGLFLPDLKSTACWQCAHPLLKTCVFICQYCGGLQKTNKLKCSFCTRTEWKKVWCNSGWNLDSTSKNYWIQTSFRPQSEFIMWLNHWSILYPTARNFRQIQKQCVEKHLITISTNIDELTTADDIVNYAICLIRHSLFEQTIGSRLLIALRSLEIHSEDTQEDDEWRDDDFEVDNTVVAKTYEMKFSESVLLQLIQIASKSEGTYSLGLLCELCCTNNHTGLYASLLQIVNRYLTTQVIDIESENFFINKCLLYHSDFELNECGRKQQTASFCNSREFEVHTNF